MKTKIFIVFCFSATLFLMTGCKGKSPSQTAQDSNAAEVSAPEQTSSTQSPVVEPKPEPVITEARPAIAESPKEQDESEDTEYFALFMDKHKIGHAIQKRVVKPNKIVTSIELSVTLSRASFPVTIQTNSISTETLDGKPLGFEIEQNLGILGNSKTVGTINENGKLIVTSGNVQEEMDWPEGALMSEGIRLLNIKYGLKEGTSYKAKMFEPSTLSAFDVEVNIGAKQEVDLLGRVVELTEIKTKASSEAVATLNADEYYDDNMRLQKSTTPVMGFVIEQVACSKKFAMGQNDVYEVMDKMFLASPAPIKNITSVKSITYHIAKTAPDADLQFPSTDNQKVQKLSNGNVVLTVEPIVAPKGISFPYKGKDPAALEALKPTRYVESNDKVIQDLAKQAVGNTKDAAEAARRIESFVANYISAYLSAMLLRERSR